MVRASSLHSSNVEMCSQDGRTTNLLPPIPIPSRLSQTVVRASSLHISRPDEEPTQFEPLRDCRSSRLTRFLLGALKAPRSE